MSDPKPKNETETPEGLEGEGKAPETISDEIEDAVELSAAEDEEKALEDGIEDAELVEEDTPDGTESEQDDQTSGQTARSDDTSGDDTPSDGLDTDETVPDDTSAGDTEVDDHLDVQQPEAVEEKPAAIAQPPAEEKKGGFFGPFLGGVVAAGLGFGLCYYLVTQGVIGTGDEDPFAEERAQIDALRDQVATLQEEVASGGEDPRVGPLVDGLSNAEGVIAALQGQISAAQLEIEAQGGLLAGIGDELGTVTAQLEAIAEMPVETGGANTAAVAALQAQLEAQQAENTEMQNQLQEMAEAARAEMEEVRARAGALQEETQAAVDEATNRAALANLTSALESGTPLAPALAALTSEAPDALSAVSDSGVMTVLVLQNTFPAAARAGLSESLKVTVGEDPGDRIMAFLQAQVGARSLEAREGDDPDAILARAQEAVTSARFSDALAEIATLPVEGQAAMADWIANAQAREDAIAARDALASELMSN